MNKYFSMVKKENELDVSIYGDITSWPMIEGDVSANNLSALLAEAKDVSKINVYINSYGGEVAEGLAIYNALKRHEAKVRTYCDGFACSIASVIFMAGDERIMNDSSLLMIHNAWTIGEGNADQLRKTAEDLDKITEASIIAYEAHSKLSREEIKALMDAESWLLPEEAIEYGFATSVVTTKRDKANQSVRTGLFEMIKSQRVAKQPEKKEAGNDLPEPNYLERFFGAILNQKN